MTEERKAPRRGRGEEKPALRRADRRVSAHPGEPAPAVRYITVDPAHEGQRLDNFLIREVKGVPKSHLYRIVRSGEVRINRARAGADQRLAAGDRIRLPPLRTALRDGGSVAPATMLPVVFEDEHLLVVDKPPSMAAHGGSGVSFGVIERVRAARPGQPFLELAHRLDRDTSGLLVLAKTRRALVGLHESLREGQVEKHYLALVAGVWGNQRQHVRVGLSRVSGGGAKVRVDEKDGAACHTVFELRERLGGFALLDAELMTGRTHQIRVHLAHLGFPIVGDDKYGNFELNRRVSRAEFGCAFARMFLHAWRIGFAHPVGSAPMRLEAALPSECEAMLEALRHA
jgi:23S rRNA pseudouridine955/2504/2580 synthase